MRGADLIRGLALADQVNHTRTLVINFGDEHALLEREESDVINAAADVRLKDASSVSAMVTAVIRLKSVLHEVLDEFEVVFTSLSDQYLCFRHFVLLCRTTTLFGVCVARRFML